VGEDKCYNQSEAEYLVPGYDILDERLSGQRTRATRSDRCDAEVPSTRSEGEAYRLAIVAGAICAYHAGCCTVARRHSGEHPREDKARP